MKILLVNKFFYRKGGSETYVFALGDALAAAGHQVIYFSMRDSKNLPCPQEAYFVDNVDYGAAHGPLQSARNALNLIYNGEAKRRFRRLMLAERPDVVHINNIHRQITLSILDVCREFNVPVVATVHDWIYVCPNYLKYAHGAICEKCTGGQVWPCVRTACVKGSRAKSLLAAAEAKFYRWRKSYELIDLYIAPSDFMAKGLRQAGFTSSPIELMYNFLPEDAVCKGGPPQTPPYFMYLGRLSGEKGVDDLIRAYAKAAPEPLLYIAGDGPERGALEALVAELAVGDRVKLLGSVYGEELEKLRDGATAVVLPSVWYENCPFSAIEVLACGKPIIGSRIGGIPELMEEGVSGLCYEAGNVDALAGCLSEMAALPPDRYAAMSRAARQRAEALFSQGPYVEQILGRYEELIKKKGAAKWQ